jgi:type I restriction enzyme S subunit
MSWKEIELADVCEIGRGSSPRPINNQAYFDGGDIPWIKIADATSSVKVIYKTKEYVNSYGASFSRLLPIDSLIVAASGTLGFPMFLGVEGCIHDGWLYFKSYNGINKEFLYYKIIDLNKYFYSKAYGAAIQNINTDTLRRTRISLPPLETQKRIASILSNYDDLIENNLKRINLLEESAQNIYKEWFVNFRFPNYEHTAFDAESGLPVGWEIKKLSELYNTSSGGTPKRDNPNYYEGSIKWFRTNELQDNFLIDSELHISEDALKNSSAKLFPKNTVLMAMYGATIGRLGVITEEASTNQACCGIIPKSEDFGNSYIYYWLLKNREHILSLRMGAAQENISQTIIKELDVIKPDLNIIKEFNSKIDKINELKINLTVQNQKLKEARDILLPRLMNRTIEV